MIWKQLKHFSPSEFPLNGRHLSDSLLLSLDKGRALLGQRIFPSPVEGAAARFGGSKTSQHYVGESPQDIVREATAVDVFAEGMPMENFLLLFGSGLFNGIGVYLNTYYDGTAWVMFHLDKREKGYEGMPLVWVAKKVISSEGEIVTKYFYPQTSSQCWSLLQNAKLYKELYK